MSVYLNFFLEIEDALPGDDEKPFHFPNPLLSPKLEDVRLHNLASILRPCKFEYGTQESKCSNNEGTFKILCFIEICRSVFYRNLCFLSKFVG